MLLSTYLCGSDVISGDHLPAAVPILKRVGRRAAEPRAQLERYVGSYVWQLSRRKWKFSNGAHAPFFSRKGQTLRTLGIDRLVAQGSAPVLYALRVDADLRCYY